MVVVWVQLKRLLSLKILWDFVVHYVTILVTHHAGSLVNVKELLPVYVALTIANGLVCIHIVKMGKSWLYFNKLLGLGYSFRIVDDQPVLSRTLIFDIRPIGLIWVCCACSLMWAWGGLFPEWLRFLCSHPLEC
jgi:hypothetical protein